MSAQPIHEHQPPRIKRTIKSIRAALPLSLHAQFDDELAEAFDAADLATPAGRERIVHDVAHAYADYERRMLPPTARRIDMHRIRAIVRVALRDIVAACA